MYLQKRFKLVLVGFLIVVAGLLTIKPVAVNATAPIDIGDCVTLQKIGNDVDYPLTSDYVLTGDIDCSDTVNWNGGKGFVPLGGASDTFTGNFNGAGHSINDLTIERADNVWGEGVDDESNVGLFAHANGATIHDLSLANAHVKGYINVGGIVGNAQDVAFNAVHVNDTTENNTCDPGHCVWARWGQYGGGIVGYMVGGAITDSSTGGNVKGSGQTIGGLVGYVSNAQITDSNSSAYVDGGQYIGGLAGEVRNSTIEGSSFTGQVDVVEEDHKTGTTGGGLAGNIYISVVRNSFSTGNVNAYYLAGGLFGYVEQTEVSGSHASGDIQTQSMLAGGIAGQIIQSDFSDSYAVGDVTAGAGNAGGFAGETLCDSSFTNDYATGNVVGSNNIGGFSGFDGCEGVGSTFTDSYATGNVQASDSYAGGFLGQSYSSTLLRVRASGSVTGTQFVGGALGWMAWSQVDQSFATGAVHADLYNVGGFLGSSISGTINDSYSTGNVNADQAFAGGFVGTIYGGTYQRDYASGSAAISSEGDERVGAFSGEAYEDSDNIVMADLFASGAVAGPAGLGGFVANLETTGMEFSNNYFDVSGTGIADCRAVAGEVTGCTGLNVNNSQPNVFKSTSSNPLPNWDFSAVWGFSPTLNNGYPCLQWQGESCSVPTSTTVDLSSAEDASHISVSGSGCTRITDTSTTKEASLPVQDPGFSYPEGFISFTMSGCQTGATATVTALFSGTYDPASIVIRKYNPNTHSFSTIPEASKSVTSFGGNPALLVSYSITDGGSLDQDGVANGTIVDPVGLGVVPVSSMPLAKTG